MSTKVALELATKDRTRGIGGSDVGAIFGLNKWMPLPKLWLQKLGRLPKQGREDKEFMEWGTLLETPIARRYAEKSRRRIRQVYRTLVHPQYPWMIGHPDRFQWDEARPKPERRGILEVKATMFGNLRAWQSGGVPATYYLQLQHYLAITGLTWGSFAVLFGGNRLVQFDVPRDDKLIDVMIERERDFWSLVETRTPPTMTLSQEWNAQLAAFFPVSEKGKQIIDASPLMVGRARRLLSLRRQIDKREAEAEGLEAALKQAMGEAQAEKLLVPKVARFTWTNGQRRYIDLEWLRKEHPAIAEAGTRTAPQRKLLVKSFEEEREEERDETEETESVVYGARMIELD